MLQKAVIIFTDNTTHKLSLEGVTLEKFNEIVLSDIAGYPDKEFHRVITWFERV